MKKLESIRIRYSNISLPIKAAVWFAVCSILQKGVSVITVPIFTRLLSTKEYGTYSLYLSWLNILSIFTSLSLYYGVFNNAMLKYENDRDGFISSMQGVVTVITSLFFICYVIFSECLNSLFKLDTLIMCMMFLDMLLLPAMQFWSAKQRFDFKYKPLVTITLLQTVLNPLLGVILVLSSESRIHGRVISILIVDILFCGSVYIYQFTKGKKFFDKKYWAYGLKFNIPLLPHYLSGSILNQGDRIMIDNLIGKTEVAIYSVAYNIGMLMNIFLVALNGAFTPWMYKAIKEYRYDEIKKSITLVLALMASLIFVLLGLAPEVVKIFATNDYYEAIYVIPPIAASVFFNLTYAFFSNIEFYYERTKFVMIASLVAAILNVILNWIFIPVYGYFAAGYTTLASYIIYCFAHYIFSKNVCAEEGVVFFVEEKKVFLLSVIVIAVTIFFTFLYKFTILRYSFISIILVVDVVYRKYIIKEISKVLHRE